MPRETDEKLHEELIRQGYSQSNSDPNTYIIQNDRGTYDLKDTDGDTHKDRDTSVWTKKND